MDITFDGKPVKYNFDGKIIDAYRLTSDTAKINALSDFWSQTTTRINS